MNERTKQLWEEAAKKTQGDSWEEQTKFIERFAELIVRECISNVEVWEKDSRNHISYMLKQQFGVKE